MLPHEETVEKYQEAVRFGPEFHRCMVQPVLCIDGSGCKAKATEELKRGLLS